MPGFHVYLICRGALYKARHAMYCRKLISFMSQLTGLLFLGVGKITRSDGFLFLNVGIISDRLIIPS